MAPEPAFTLGDLLDQEALSLELRAGGDGARARRVAGAHSIEIERPSSWLGPDWVMLTTGARLIDDEPAQRDLVAELDAAGTQRSTSSSVTPSASCMSTRSGHGSPGP